MTEGSDRELYKQAGVNVAKGDELVSWLQTEDRRSAEAHQWGEAVSGIGGFSALYRPHFGDMQDPLLVSGTDGVGTKVLLGLATDRLEGLGGDLVAMCVNDLYTIGGRPLFFLDYYATGILDEQQFKRVMTGIRKGLHQAETLLMGGETAELPGLYQKGHFDLAGFVVGVVDGARKLDPSLCQGDEQLFALPSSGFHSNGYSLIRHWLADDQAGTDEFIDQLMTPTRIYAEIPTILKSLAYEGVSAIAHITGGGISGNLPRVLPAGLQATIERQKLPTADWMKAFLDRYQASFEQVEGVFNLGAGMICAVRPQKADEFLRVAAAAGVDPTWIGQLAKTDDSGPARVKYV
jgi:phosphoribosylformylglycinamidine cyclo-ligase